MTRSSQPAKRQRASKSPFAILNGFQVAVRSADGRKFTPEEAAMHGVLMDAFAGNASAMRECARAIQTREASTSPAFRPPIIMHAFRSPVLPDEALQLLGLATQQGDQRRDDDGPYLKLEPWFVTLACERTEALALSETDRRTIRRDTRDEGYGEEDWESA